MQQDEGSTFRLPTELRVSTSHPRRALIIGSCLVGGLTHYLKTAGSDGDYLVFNNLGELPPQPPRPLEDYDFQAVQIAVRSVLPERAYFRILHSEEAHESLFREAEERLFHLLAATMRWNIESGLLSLVFNFLVPQQNPLGRMLARHDSRNMVRFFHRLNDSLSLEVSRYRNAYVLDCDEISASFGRRYFQDDAYVQLNHASGLPDDDPNDHERISMPRPIREHYPNKRAEIIAAMVQEMFAMYRTAKQVDSVKLVIVDLDDTLWRGLVVENWRGSGHATEGYPLGFAEALLYLKARGILLAIVSKNDEEKVAGVWDHVWLGRLSLDDFAIRKINWAPKEENVEAIIGAVNLLPSSVVFIDDNPVERAAIATAFPGIRTMGDEPYVLRRALLWSPETQVPFITAESAQRTKMMQAQVERETARSRLSREEFLASLNVRTTVFAIADINHSKFPRAFELLNKTNQFNTTGRRLTFEECRRAFAQGVVFHAFEVEDKYTAYGLVGMAIISDDHIEQFVMSCRVIGLGVETQIIADIVRELHSRGTRAITAAMVNTETNHLCKDLFARCGFSRSDDVWTHAIPVRRGASTLPVTA